LHPLIAGIVNQPHHAPTYRLYTLPTATVQVFFALKLFHFFQGIFNSAVPNYTTHVFHFLFIYLYLLGRHDNFFTSYTNFILFSFC